MDLNKYTDAILDELTFDSSSFVVESLGYGSFIFSAESFFAEDYKLEFDVCIDFYCGESNEEWGKENYLEIKNTEIKTKLSNKENNNIEHSIDFKSIIEERVLDNIIFDF